MSRSWTKPGATWQGQVLCQRERCNERFLFPVENEPPERTYFSTPGSEEVEAYNRRRTLAAAELASKPLPRGWIEVKIAGDDRRMGNEPYVFHSAHCAALWLNKRGVD